MTTAQLRGRRLLTYKPVIAEDINQTLQDDPGYGDNVLTLDQPFQDLPAYGTEAVRMLKAGTSVEETRCRSVFLRVDAGVAVAQLAAALEGDVGDLCTVTESVSGVNGVEYFIAGARVRQTAPRSLDVTFSLARREQRPWLIGIAGRSEIGETTFFAMSSQN